MVHHHSSEWDPPDLTFVPYRLAADAIVQKLVAAVIPFPRIGIICGSGLSGLSQTLQGPTLTVSYGDIPGFPSHCTVAGHTGEVVFGMLSRVPAMIFKGRFHSYEGHDMKTVVLPVHVMRCLNVQICIITNAAGALNPALRVGDVVCVTDHLALPQLAGKNPLIGINDEELGPRFPATSNAYPVELRQAAVAAASEMGIDFLVPTGVYCFVSGPMYESKAECRFLRSLGGDVVGMSTIPEVVASHHCQMKTLVLSLVTNKVVTNEKTTETEEEPIATHQEVLQAAQERSQQMQTLTTGIVAQLRDHVLPALPVLSSVSLQVSPAARREYSLYRQASLLTATHRQPSSASSFKKDGKGWWTGVTAAATVVAVLLLLE